MKLLTVELNRNDEIVIRIPKSHLIHLTEMHIEDEFPEEGIRITNANALVADVCQQLSDDLDETGDTLVYRMINEAIGAAMENGSLAFDDDDDNVAKSRDEY